ncbi:MAG TPA: sialidase family protein [Mycobacteriales bacterium]|nr:sialidase family protein [Mycobacteriales bacterium]
MIPRRALAVLAAAAAAAAAVGMSADAASPSGGTVSASKRTLVYATAMQFGSVFGLAGLEGVACPPASQDPGDLVCDHFALKVDVPASHWKRHKGGVQVRVPASFYGYAYTPAGKLAAASNWTGDERTMLIPEAAGSYEIRLAPYAAFGPSDVRVTFVSTPGSARVETGTALSAYHGTILTKQPKARPQNTAIAYPKGTPPLAFRSTYIGRGAAEPTLGVDKQGRAFYAAGAFDALPKQSPKNQARTVLLRSTDRNRSWQSVQPPVLPGAEGTDGHPATLDPYVYVDPVTGRVFDVDLTLAGSYLSYSDDQGKTWTRGAAVSAFGANDHQTLFAGPLPLGLVSVDPAFPRAVYYCVNQIDGSFCARSLDGGKSFVNSGAPVYPPGTADAANGVPFCGGLHGHGVTDSAGRLFVPRGFCGSPEISISENGGLTWRQTSVLAEGSSILADHIQSSVAVDSADNLYYTWYDDTYQLPYLSVSKDHGVTWTKPRMIAPPGVKATNFPTIDAGTPGRIALTFPGTRSADANDVTRPWHSYVVVSTNALSTNPTFLSVVANPGGLADPVHRGDCQRRCGRMYDFLDVVVAPDAGGTVWATATDTCTTLDSCSTKRVGGFSGASGEHGASDAREGVAMMQVSGPRLWVGSRRR